MKSDTQPCLTNAIDTRPAAESFAPCLTARPILSYLTADPNAASRFWGKVAIAGPDDCWDWTASKSGKGYGNFKIASFEPRQAHRVAWVIANQRDTDGLLVRHTCDRPSCCNPAHLLLGTAKDNSDDKFSRGRARSSRQDGENNGHAILTTEQVGQIVAALKAGEGNQQIANRFPVSDSLVSRIRTGRSWQKEAASFGWQPCRLVAPPPARKGAIS